MSKVICDVCGTAYPETAAQCPICNSARNSAEQTSAATTGKNEPDTSGYVYVKGGRFSKKNVKKRSRAGAAAVKQGGRGNREEERSGNTGLIIVVILLMLAIVAVVGYICVHFFDLSFDNNNSGNNANNGNGGNTEPSTSVTEATELTISCQSIQLSNAVIEFTEAGESWTLEVEVTPVDTTDAIVFASSDEAVVTVDNSGTITAVGGGTAEITVTCGSVVQTCTVSCSFGQTETEPPVTGEFDFAFNTVFTDSTTGYGDLTLDVQGKTWRAYKNDVSVSPYEITWTSDDPSVCTIEDGIVTAVGPGRTLIHAQYNGVTYTCIVRCSFTVAQAPGTDETEPDGSENNGDNTEEMEATEPETGCTISHTDVTVAVGTSFKLTLKDADGNVLDVVWEADKEGYVTIEGSKITGVTHSLAGVKVSATYEGVTYTCIVRIN